MADKEEVISGERVPCYDMFIMDGHNKYKALFDFIMVAVASYSGIMSLYYVAFSTEDDPVIIHC